MALKKLPGGVIIETDGGARLNEDAGVNLEAIHRQLAASIDALADATEATLDELGRQWTISHVARTATGRLVFAQGTGTIPVTRTSTGRLAVTA